MQIVPRSTVRRQLAEAVAAWLIAAVVFAAGVTIATLFGLDRNLGAAFVTLAVTFALFPHAQAEAFRRGNDLVEARAARQRRDARQPAPTVVQPAVDIPASGYVGRHACDTPTGLLSAVGTPARLVSQPRP